jgi:A/G-specific adenine glycosylase
MLQQTRVDTVIPYYERFLARFPDVAALADADEQDVLREWAGLGYYSRARNLKRAAEQIVREHAGQVPRDAEQLAALPGVGPYTVGAIRSIAFDEPAALVDGNVARVLSRWTARETLAPADLWALARSLVPGDAPGAFNQALMELGATLCTPRLPRCDACPVAAHCAAYASGAAERYPAPRKRRAPLEVEALGAVIERMRPEGLLMTKRPSNGLLGGLWEVPSLERASSEELRLALEQRTGLALEKGVPLGGVRHLFTHRSLTLHLERFALADGGHTQLAAADVDELRWCSPAELDALPLSTLMRKVLKTLADSRRRLL